jgi:hypothetical protein
MKPQRIQLSRRKGWRMPENTVRVARPGMWGNRFIVSPTVRPGSRSGADYICVPTVEDAVECYRLYMQEQMAMHECVRSAVAELRGKNLACWCQLGSPCHADVLLEIANAPDAQQASEGKA